MARVDQESKSIMVAASRQLAYPDGLVVGCERTTGGISPVFHRENPPQIQSGVCRLPKWRSVQSYTLSLGQSNSISRSISRSLSIQIVIGRIIADSAKPIVL